MRIDDYEHNKKSVTLNVYCILPLYKQLLQVMYHYVYK